MDLHQTSSILDDQSTALANEDQMVDNVMTVLPIQLTNTTGTRLQHLNEDCLLEIFSRNPLTPMDLCTLAVTCDRFKQITQRMFSKGFDIECYKGFMDKRKTIYLFSLKDQSRLECTFQNTERILKNFGAHLSELYMEKDLALVNLVAKYCDGITLKRLQLTSIEGVTQQFDSIFRRLLQLEVHECDLRMAQWNVNCDSLIELVIGRSKNVVALLRHTFPILERFCFDYNERSADNIDILSEFVSRHRCLKSVKIDGPLVTSEQAKKPINLDICKLLRAISCSCTELVELTIHRLPSGSFDISHLQTLAKLKVLNIHFNCIFGGYPCDQLQCEHVDSSRALKSLRTLEISFITLRGWYRVPNQIFDILYLVEELKLIDCVLDDFQWTRLPQLRKVYLWERCKSSYGSVLLDIITASMNLEKLTFKWIDIYEDHWEDDDVWWPLTEEEFSKICKIVERRAHILTLECHCDFIDEENWNDKRNVKLIKISNSFDSSY